MTEQLPQGRSLFPNPNHTSKEELAMNLARRPFSETGQNGRSEENGNSPMFCYEDKRIQSEVELIHRKLIESGDLLKLRELMTRNLYEGVWKHEVLALCRDAVKKQNGNLNSLKEGSKDAVKKQEPIPFEILYNSVKESAKGKVDNKLRDKMVSEVEKQYRKAIENSPINNHSTPVQSRLTE